MTHYHQPYSEIMKMSDREIEFFIQLAYTEYEKLKHEQEKLRKMRK